MIFLSFVENIDYTVMCPCFVATKSISVFYLGDCSDQQLQDILVKKGIDMFFNFAKGNWRHQLRVMQPSLLAWKANENPLRETSQPLKTSWHPSHFAAYSRADRFACLAILAWNLTVRSNCGKSNVQMTVRVHVREQTFFQKNTFGSKLERYLVVTALNMITISSDHYNIHGEIKKLI